MKMMPKDKTAMMSAGRSNDNLKKVIDLTYEMLELADHGDTFRSDAGCGVVYGALRDSAYKIRQMAFRELSEHGVPLPPDAIKDNDANRRNAPNEVNNQNERKGK
ncbi:MAG: hypothetical protein ACOZBW_03525 [Thermodesulfobacteriota bacterium]